MIGIARIAAIQGRKADRRADPVVSNSTVSPGSPSNSSARSGVKACTARSAQSTGRTGVEMEALTAASIGLLTIYDMCKAIDRGMHRRRAAADNFGKSGHWLANDGNRHEARPTPTIPCADTCCVPPRVQRPCCWSRPVRPGPIQRVSKGSADWPAGAFHCDAFFHALKAHGSAGSIESDTFTVTGNRRERRPGHGRSRERNSGQRITLR